MGHSEACSNLNTFCIQWSVNGSWFTRTLSSHSQRWLCLIYVLRHPSQLTLLPTHPRLSLAKWPEPKWALGNPSLLGDLLKPCPRWANFLPLPKRQVLHVSFAGGFLWLIVSKLFLRGGSLMHIWGIPSAFPLTEEPGGTEGSIFRNQGAFTADLQCLPAVWKKWDPAKMSILIVN